MAFVIYRIYRHGKTDRKEIDVRHSEESQLEIGRNTTDGIFLSHPSVAWDHALIEQSGSTYVIRPLADVMLYRTAVNGVPLTGEYQLAHQDTITIGPYTLRVSLPSPNAPATIVVAEQSKIDTPLQARVAYVGQYKLSQSPVTKGRLTIVGVGLFLVAIGLVVALGHTAGGSAVKGMLAPGKVAMVHNLFAHNCAQCHGDAGFTSSDEACKVCHAGAQHQQHDAATPACAMCHVEHRGRQARLVPRTDQVCTGCHADLRLAEKRTSQFAADIRGFTEGHPEFTVPMPGQQGQPPRRVRLNAQVAPHDVATICFNHEVHLTLSPERLHELGMMVRDLGMESIILTPERLQRGMTCTLCHQMDERGAYMKPIAYADHCQTCHPLQFDQDSPAQVLHRQQPAQMQDFLRKFYRDRCLDSSEQFAPTSSQGSEPLSTRLFIQPSMPQAARARVVLCAQEGVQQANEAQQRLYARGKQAPCLLCHTLRWANTPPPYESSFGGQLVVTCEQVSARSRPPLHESPPVGQLPTVEKTAIVPRWFAHSVFNHRVHANILGACTHCHGGAKTSQQTSDILLPHVQQCQQCHRASDGARATCVMCHRYHNRTDTQAREVSFIEQQAKGEGRDVWKRQGSPR